MAASTADNNFHESYVHPGSFVKGLIEMFDLLVEQNETVEIPEVLIDVYGEFTKPWTYDWATPKEYVERLEEWIVCGPESFVGALVLMRRLERMGTIPPLTQKTFHRVYLTCLVLAVKVMEDETLNNTDFGKVGCVSVQELNLMETHLCKALNFNCSIREDEYDDCVSELRAFESLPIKKKKAKNFLPRNSPTDPISLELLFAVVRESTEKRKPSLSKRTSEFFISVKKSANTRRLSATHSVADMSGLVSPQSHKSDKITPVFIIRQDSL